MLKSLLLKIVTILLVVIVINDCKAQQTTITPDSVYTKRAQTIYAEFYGPGITLSGNYDTRFFNRRDGWGSRIGIGGAGDNDFSLLSFPVQINYLLGKTNKFFELGAGATLISYNNKNGDGGGYLPFDDGKSLIGTMTFGYQRQPVDNGFNFRGSFNTLFSTSMFIPYFGISLGYTF